MLPDTVTTAEAFADPPDPVHVRVKVLLAAVSAPVLAEPAVARLPDHAPEAVQDVASVELQVRFDAPPLATPVGLALSITVGAGADAVTVTVTLLFADPLAPVQANVNELLAAVSGPVLSVPVVAFEPVQSPDAVQLVALLDDQVSVELAPLVTFTGSAVNVTVGAAGGVVTVTVTEPSFEPPSPVHPSV